MNSYTPDIYKNTWHIQGDSYIMSLFYNSIISYYSYLGKSKSAKISRK